MLSLLHVAAAPTDDDAARRRARAWRRARALTGFRRRRGTPVGPYLGPCETAGGDHQRRPRRRDQVAATLPRRPTPATALPEISSTGTSTCYDPRRRVPRGTRAGAPALVPGPRGARESMRGIRAPRRRARAARRLRRRVTIRGLPSRARLARDRHRVPQMGTISRASADRSEPRGGASGGGSG